MSREGRAVQRDRERQDLQSGPEGPPVLGPTVDAQTRCIHYRTVLDVIAIRFACCGEFYPCHLCHEETAGHPSRPWPAASRHERAILCGLCRCELTIQEYTRSPHDPRCPRCGAVFNPRCSRHHALYFAPAGERAVGFASLLGHPEAGNRPHVR